MNAARRFFRHWTVCVLLALASAVQATEIALDLPEQDLQATLVELSRVAGVQVLYSTDLVYGLKNSSINGPYSLEAALDRLLEGTGLVYRRATANTILIERQEQPTTLRTIRIVGTRISANSSRDIHATEGSGNYAAPGASVGSPSPQSLKDIPRSVSVIGQAQLRDQGIFELADAVAQLPAVALTVYPGDTISANVRGRNIDFYQYDGGATLQLPTSSVINGDLSAYDRVELLRGADGLGNGFASSAGILNLVRKRPLSEPQLVMEARAGYWDHYGGMLDVSKPLGWDGRLRGRAVLSGVDKQYFYERGYLRRNSTYGTIEADLSGSTLLTLGGHFIDHDGLPVDGGALPVSNTGAQVGFPRDTSFYLPFEYDRLDSRQLFTNLQQDLGSNWSLRLAVEHLDQDRQTLGSNLAGEVDVATGEGVYLLQFFSENRSTTKLADLKLLGKFYWLDQPQMLTTILTYADQYSQQSFLLLDTPEVNAFDFPPPISAPVFEKASLRSSRLRRYSASTTFTFKPNEPLTLSTSYRTSIQSDQEHPRTEKHGISFVGATWSIAQEWSGFASWADAYRIDGFIRTTVSGGLAEPTVGDNYEIGLKYARADGALNAAIALYRTERSNYSVRLSDPPPFDNCCYATTPTLHDRIHGVDAELAGQLWDDVQASASYTFATDAYSGGLHTVGGGPIPDAQIPTRIPRHSFKLWASWAPASGTLRSIELGAGIRARTGSTHAGLTVGQVPQQQPGYAVTDARVAWRFQPQWTLALNIYNVFDRYYYATISEYGFANNFYGEPRNLVLGLRGEF